MVKRSLHRTILVVGVLAMLLTACSQLPQDPLLKNLERRSGLIVYVGTDGNIHTVDQGGGSQKDITTDAGSGDAQSHIYQHPTWSPDSRKIAFAEISTENQSFALARVYVAEPDGQGVVEAYASEDRYPIYLYWSPDSRHVSFLESAGSGDLTLQMVPAQGGQATTLDAGGPYYWSWSPDSRRLLVHVGTSSQARLSYLNLNDGVTEEGLSLQPGLFQAPAFSPDGEKLLLAAETDDGDPALMLTDRNGAVRSVLKLLEGSTAFGWSPDGKRVAYIASSELRPFTLGPLTVLDPDQAAEAKTTEDDGVWGFFWSPDSQKIAYFVPLIYEPTPEPGQSGESNSLLLLELHVMDAVSGASRSVTTFVPTDDFRGVMQYFDQYQHSTTIWSPDSKNLVISGYPARGEPQELGAWIVAASGNLEPRFLTEASLAFWSWK